MIDFNFAISNPFSNTSSHIFFVKHGKINKNKSRLRVGSTPGGFLCLAFCAGPRADVCSGLLVSGLSRASPHARSFLPTCRRRAAMRAQLVDFQSKRQLRAAWRISFKGYSWTPN